MSGRGKSGGKGLGKGGAKRTLNFFCHPDHSFRLLITLTSFGYFVALQVTARFFVITFKVSPSLLSEDWLVEVVSNVSLA